MIDAITKNFDIWTDAQGIKSKGRVKSVENISLDGIAALRKLIKELAVSGNLVKEKAFGESAKVLINKIVQEKEELIQKGTIKREKPLTISDKEKPFKLPKGWEWVKLGNIGTTNIGLTYSPKDISNEGVLVLRSSNIQNGEITFNDNVRVTSSVKDSVFVKQGDILICARNGSRALVGKCALINNLPEPMAFGAFMAVYRSPINQFVKIYLDSPIYRRSLDNIETTTINQITQDAIKNTVIAVPPLDEQDSIVSKVNELMAICDSLEAGKTNNLKTHQILVKTLLETLIKANDANQMQMSWQRLSMHFDMLFCTEDSIDQLKATILQLAIMGKLLQQEQKDEPTKILLNKIENEKIKLVKDGKIKKEISLPVIKEQEKPFGIPKSWEWVRLGTITNKIGSGSTPRGGNNSYSDSGIAFLRSQNVRNEGVMLDDVVYINAEINKKMSGTTVLPNDILLNITGGSLGRTAIFPKEIGTANVSQHVTIIRPTITTSSSFLHKCILSPYLQDLIWGRQIGANREGLSKKVMELFEIPYPPLAEQQRIVAKVDELMIICDKLKERINKAQDVQRLLSKIVIEEAIA